MKPEIEIYIRKHLFYNPASGSIKWVRSPSPYVEAGSIAGSVWGNRRRIKIKNRPMAASRIAWLLHHGEWPKGCIDHINGDSLDNRICNLRDVTHLENSRNRPRQKNNTSGVPGVYWNKSARAWRAQIYIKSNLVLLGYFKDWFNAVCARKTAENRYNFHPNHGRENAT